MELQTKFIEGTNEQYSIREDGAVFRNYTNRKMKGTDNKLYKTVQMRKRKECVIIHNYKVSTSIKFLVFEHFGYCFCKQCNKKLDYLPLQYICKECLKINFKASVNKCYANNKKKYREAQKIYRENNLEKHKSIITKTAKKVILNATKSYIANCFGIPRKDLTDELYEMHRDRLLFKRQVAKEHNISIHKLN
jgi:hypothetical protein